MQMHFRSYYGTKVDRIDEMRPQGYISYYNVIITEEDETHIWVEATIVDGEGGRSQSFKLRKRNLLVFDSEGEGVSSWLFIEEFGNLGKAEGAPF